MEKLSIHDFARDIAAVVEHEKQGPVVVVGHAWGFPARQLATDRPELVRGVVLAAASALLLLSPGLSTRADNKNGRIRHLFSRYN
ncbi:alpha/beta fold hydrolase [Pseudomonas putida]|uniref:alpha/beta fold hydrolase n=1 Tax=Pseudomonas putida TaxID=303 RepID=UPI0038621329